MLSIIVAVHNQLGHNRLFLEGIQPVYDRSVRSHRRRQSFDGWVGGVLRGERVSGDSQ